MQYCLFYNDRKKEFSDDQADQRHPYNGNYIGGIDVKNTLNWTISDNVFIGIQGRTREGRGAIYISENGRGSQHHSLAILKILKKVLQPEPPRPLFVAQK